MLAEQAEAQSRAVTSAARATALSDARYRGGFVSQLELLDAQRSELRNRRQACRCDRRSTRRPWDWCGAGWRVGRMSDEDRKAVTGPVLGYVAAAIALVILLIA
jgi:hypothetical protein